MFEKHGVKGVTIHNFVRSSPEGTLIKVRKNEDTLYYNPKTNIFAIKNADGIASNLIAHAILGAVVAELQGNSALSGGAGAVAGEVAADIIRKQLYGKEVKDLTEEEKQTISALSQLASGLAVAAGGGNIGDASAAINSSKNAVENNYLSVNEAKRKAYLTWIKPNYLGEELTEDEKKELENLNKLDKERDQILQDNCSLGNISSSACKGLLQEAWEMQNEYEKEVARSLTNADLYREDSKNLNEALVGLDPNSIIHLISIEAIAKETGRDVKDVAQQYKYVMAAHGIVSSLAGLYGGVNFTQPNTNIGKPGNIVNKVDDIAGKGTGVKTNTEQADNVIIKPSTNATETFPTVDQLSQAAASVNRNGLTDAGRALQKYGGLEGSVYTYSNQ